jgi:hypothetical protein
MLTLKNKHRSSKHPGKGKLALQQISIRNTGGSEEYVVAFAQVISAQNLQHKATQSQAAPEHVGPAVTGRVTAIEREGRQQPAGEARMQHTWERS